MKENQMKILDLKSTLSELKILLKGFDRRYDMAITRISELEGKSMEAICSKENVPQLNCGTT